MIQEKRFLSDLDTNGVDGFWLDNSNPDNLRTVEQVEKHYQEVIQRMEESVDHNAVQDRLNKAHAIGFRDGAKATELILNKEIERLKELLEKAEGFISQHVDNSTIRSYSDLNQFMKAIR